MIYLYENPKTGEIKEVPQGMNDPHVYSEGGIEWKRVFTIPCATIKGSADPFNQQSFVEETGSKRGTVGDMLDYSRELSEKRAQRNGGVDPIQSKFFKDYQKRVGKKHLNDPSRIDKSKLKNSFVSVTE